MAKKKVIIRQTYTDKSIESVILDGQDRVGTSLLGESWLQGSAFLYSLYGEQFSLECSANAQDVRSKYLPKNPRPEYDIYFASRQGYPFCAIGVAKTDGPWFKQYSYYTANASDGCYTMYEIGLGKQGLRYPIFRDGIQVAVICKRGQDFDNLDTYEIIATSDRAVIMAVTLSMYLDADSFLRGGHVFKHTHYEGSYTTKTYYLTTNAGIMAHYNPDFERM